MSMQHAEFAKENAVFIGSPSLARLLVSRSDADLVAETRAGCPVGGDYVGFPGETFVTRAPVDPVRVPSDLRMSIRALPRIEARVSAIARRMEFTFWGEAVALILGFVAAAPHEFDLRHLRMTAPEGLLRAKGTLKRGASLAPVQVRRIHSPVTPATAAFVDRVAGWERVSRSAASALILHRHAATVAARIGAR